MKATLLFAWLVLLGFERWLFKTSEARAKTSSRQPIKDKGKAKRNHNHNRSVARQRSALRLPEAKAMLQKAGGALPGGSGPKQALADFSAPKKAPFADRDLYVFCVGANSSTLTANGAFPTVRRQCRLMFGRMPTENPGEGDKGCRTRQRRRLHAVPNDQSGLRQDRAEDQLLEEPR